MHLPQPRILGGEHDRRPASVPLVREEHARRALGGHAPEKVDGSRLQLEDPVHGGEGRKLRPALGGRLGGLRDPHRRVPAARQREFGRHLKHVRLAGSPEHHRQRVGQRRPRIAALPQRPPPAQHEESAPALSHEIRHHLQLVVREEARLHAPQNQPVVLVQLLARAREPAGEFTRPLHIEPQVFFVGRPQERDDVQVLVVRHGAAHELVLRARRALEVEDLPARVADLHEDLTLVVAGQRLSLLRVHEEADRAGPRFLQGELELDRFLAIRPEREIARAHDAPLVLHIETHRATGESRVRDDDVGHDRRPLERRAGHLHATHLDIRSDPFRAQSDRVDGNPRGARREQRLREGRGRLIIVVRAVGDDDDSGERKSGHLLLHAGEARREVRTGAGEGHLARPVDPVRVGIESVHPQPEAVLERLPERAFAPRRRERLPVGGGRGRGIHGGGTRHAGVGGQGIGRRSVRPVRRILRFSTEEVEHPLRARFPVLIRHAHAARVVQEDRHEVPPRDDGRDEEHRPQQEEGEDPERRHPQPHEDPAVARLHRGADAAVFEREPDDGSDPEEDENHPPPGGGEGEVAAFEHDGSVFEEELEHVAGQPSPSL